MWMDLFENTMEHLDTGGWVMFPLILVSIFMTFLITRKLLEMRLFTKGDLPMEQCVASIGKPDFSAAAWQMDIINGFLKKRTRIENLDRSILECLRLREESFVKRYTGTINILANIAPLLGLLGTVGGMIKTFAVIALYGTGNAKALASGISEALITTQTGLVVAIPGIFLAGFLRRKSDKLLDRMQRFCLGLLKSHHGIEA
ncbi:MAG: MotA/TolQ/ExbB proton channel family protein [Deltaproteobacteria bacterium]|nr:MotA/TolQ/ExbB proton channel family protein [Deltaproteobacteria bacterium]